MSDTNRTDDPATGADIRAFSHIASDNAAHHRDSNIRETLVSEIDCMARFQISNGTVIGAEISEALALMEAGHRPDLADLIRTHQALAALSDITPRTIRMILEAGRGGAVSGMLGPTPAVRRLTLATLFFAIAFFVTSLSGEINVETMNSSIYELDGAKLAIKLLLIISSAGLGAGFAVLFDVWRDLKQYRFDPISESANWMQLGLGVIAGLVLSEIVSSERVLSGASAAGDESMMLISGPLLALVGGFSATILHLVLKNLVDAFKRALEPGSDERPAGAVRGTSVASDSGQISKDVQGAEPTEKGP